VQRPKEELLKEEAKSDNEADDVVVAESSVSSTVRCTGTESWIAQTAHKSKKKNAKARNALPKKISAAKDEVDAILVRMKEAKYLETDIAEHLSKHYDVTYSPKTIGTRYTRLKRAAQAASDKLLDEDQTCWHDGDVSLRKPCPVHAKLHRRTKRCRRLSSWALRSSRPPKRSSTRPNGASSLISSKFWSQSQISPPEHARKEPELWRKVLLSQL
jgi:hypothetical protein